jgi:type IV pilus assembly protein PilE
MALLSEAAAREERYFAQNNAYTTDASKLAMRNSTTTGSGNSASTTVTSDTGKYSLSIANPSDSGGYRLTATPQGVQAKDTKCANLTLDATGTKGISGTGSVSDCWK